MLGRALGHAYSRKWLSDALVVFTGVWAFALTDRALTLGNENGAAVVAMYLPLLWVPILMWLAGRWRPDQAHPPTLLVLRVFQQDTQTQSLFDHVIERWRLSGNTVLIAGTDLANRTLDAEDIFQFLDRRLAERFVVSPAMSRGASPRSTWLLTLMVVTGSTSAIATTRRGRTRYRHSSVAATSC
jgi:hypothetical protein